MPILLAVGGFLLLALVFGPQLWIRHVLASTAWSGPTCRAPVRSLRAICSTRRTCVRDGGEDRHGDHYDPEAQAVRLLPQHHDGRSIAAVAVAAHEVSHAVQHARGEPAFMRRLALVRQLVWVESSRAPFCCCRRSCSRDAVAGAARA